MGGESDKEYRPLNESLDEIRAFLAEWETETLIQTKAPPAKGGVWGGRIIYKSFQ